MRRSAVPVFALKNVDKCPVAVSLPTLSPFIARTFPNWKIS